MTHEVQHKVGVSTKGVNDHTQEVFCQLYGCEESDGVRG
jgi:hypothetical protein